MKKAFEIKRLYFSFFVYLNDVNTSTLQIYAFLRGVVVLWDSIQTFSPIFSRVSSYANIFYCILFEKNLLKFCLRNFPEIYAFSGMKLLFKSFFTIFQRRSFYSKFLFTLFCPFQEGAACRGGCLYSYRLGTS